MVRKWLSACFSVLCIISYGSEPGEMDKLVQKINDLEEAGAQHLVLKTADQLYEKAKSMGSDSLQTEYKCTALRHKLNQFRLSDFEAFEKSFRLLEQEIRSDIPKSIISWFAYYVYKYELLTHYQEYVLRLEVLEQLEKYILSKKKEIDRQDLNFYQLLIQNRRGDVYLSENNFAQSRNHYELALIAARAVDEFEFKKNHKVYDYERLQIINLFKVAVISKNENDVLKLTQLLKLKSRKSIYSKNWEREFIQAVLYESQIPMIHLKELLPRLSTNVLLQVDPLNFIKISQYFLDSNYVSEAEYYKEKARLLLPSFANSAVANVEYNLLLAKLALVGCNASKMDSLIKQAKKWLVDQPVEYSRPKIRCSRRDYLAFMQKATGLYTRAFEQGGDRSLLHKCAALTDEAIQTLFYLRLDLPDETDRTILLTQLNDFCVQALNNYAELFKITPPTTLQASVLLNYFDANKSFNLLLSRRLKNAITPENWRDLNELEIRIKKINQNADYVYYGSDSLISQKSTLIDSSVKILERAVGQSEVNIMLSLDQIQNKLHKNQTILEYFSSNDELFALMINKATISFKKLQIHGPEGEANLDEQLLLLGDYIEAGSTASEFPVEEYKLAAFKIYTVLVNPFADQIKSKIIIVPDVNMSNLPWAALLTQEEKSKDCRKWKYWLKTHSIATQHSLSMWLNQSQIENSPTSATLPISIYGPKFENLKYNRAECDALNQVLPGSLFMGEYATLKHFNENAPKSRIIHISSHAKASMDFEDSSYVLFSGDTLYNNAIRQQNLSAQLVFLSACETGLGKAIHAEGVMSFARSFFQAGAHAVISTSWKVNDETHYHQVIQTYKNLLKGQSKDQAIRSMQLDYLKNAKNYKQAYPFYWAAFQCQGDLNPIFESKNYFIKVLLGVGLLIGILAIFFGIQSLYKK